MDLRRILIGELVDAIFVFGFSGKATGYYGEDVGETREFPVRGRTILPYYCHRLLGESYGFCRVNVRGKLRCPRMGKSPAACIARLGRTGKSRGKCGGVRGNPMFPRI